jgi:hypothetical protein
VSAVPYFLLAYDRPRGEILRQQEFGSWQEGLPARFEAEREYAGSPDVEIVLLGAESIEALRATHRRYFESIGEIVSPYVEEP